MVLSEIKEQLEYYFSDANYARDRFMREVAKKNDGCIPIETILTFKRLKALKATAEEVKKAAEESGIISLVNESVKKIETEEYLAYCKDKEVDKRIVHMSGFNSESTLEQIRDILSQHCKPVRVLMKRDSKKQFTGECFVEFRTKEEVDAVLSLEIRTEGRNEPENETVKKQKVDFDTLKITRKVEYSKKEKENAGGKFIEKVKKDFIGKLYRYEGESEIGISDLKKLVKNAAFVDLEKKVVRMKYQEEWNENVFEGDGKKIKLAKLEEEAAKEYVAALQIKKVPKKTSK